MVDSIPSWTFTKLRYPKAKMHSPITSLSNRREARDGLRGTVSHLRRCWNLQSFGLTAAGLWHSFKVYCWCWLVTHICGCKSSSEFQFLEAFIQVFRCRLTLIS